MKLLVSGSREFLFDEAGQRYIDAISGVYNASYGHGHPRITHILRTFPMDGIINCYDNSTPERRRLENELCAQTGFREVHLFSSGAESVEKALLLALQSVSPARRRVLHFLNSFHGKTMGTESLFHPCMLKSPYRTDTVDPMFPEERLLERVRARVRNGCGVVILEPVMGYFGHIFPLRVLAEIRRICSESETILIFDEMITGFGRAGHCFVSDVVRPDILVLGKNLGQGLPIMAILFNPGGLISTEGSSWTTATANNALLCRVGYESCRILVEEAMTSQSFATGKNLRAALTRSGVFSKCTVDNCASMMFIRRLDNQPALPLEVRLREEYQILTRAHGSTLVMMPPYVTSIQSCDRIGEALGEVLKNE